MQFSVFKKIFQSRFFRNVSTLSTGTIIASFISIGATLLLTRLYDPASIGNLAIFTSVTMVLASIITLSYEHSIVIPSDDDVADQISRGTLMLALICSVTLAILAEFLIYFDFSYTFDQSGIWLRLIAPSVFSVAVINISMEWFTRNEKYKIISFCKVLQASITNLTQVMMGYLFSAGYWLIVGFVAGRYSALFLYLKKSTYLTGLFPLDLKKHIGTLKKFNNYPRYILPTVVLDRVSIEAPYFLLAFFFGDAYVGFFSIAFRVIAVPLTLIGSSIAQVFFKKLSVRKNEHLNLKPYLIKTWLSLAVIGIFPVSVILIGSGDLFAFVFGEQWAESGYIALLLTPLMYIDFISSPTGKSFLVLRLEYLSTVFSIIRLITTFASIIFGSIFGGVTLAILLFSLSRALLLAIQNFVLLKKVGKDDQISAGRVI